MKITILSENLSSKPTRRAHRLAEAARTFANVKLIGPGSPKENLAALHQEPWITTVRKKRFPKFFKYFNRLVKAANGDLLIAVKPHLATFGVALVAAELRGIPVILDLDDLDIALAPRLDWASNTSMTDLTRPGSAVYTSLLTKAAGAASAITVSSTALRERFGGTLIPHGSSLTVFDPADIDRQKARRTFGFVDPTVLFPGIPRAFKGLKTLAEAVRRVPGARLAVTCRPKDLIEPEWEHYPLDRISIVPYSCLAKLLVAADVIAIPQLDSEPARHQMPMKVFDAMAMGKPIVASMVSDLPLVLEGCSRLVPPGDVDKLADAISRLLSTPEEARILGERARARCLKDYSTQRIGEKLFEVVRQVVQ